MNAISRNSICLICGQTAAFIPFRILPKFLFGIRSKIYKCTSCGAGRTFPGPKTDAAYYESNEHYENLFSSKIVQYRKFSNQLIDFVLQASTKLETPVSKGRLLDIGAGRGFLVEQACIRGFDAVGVELNRQNVQMANRNGIPLYESLVEFEKEDGSSTFDVLVFSAVLEHMPDPIQFVTSYKRYLRPGGLIVIVQAAFDGLLPSAAPWLWYGWQPREHFWHFDFKTIEVLLRRSGAQRWYIDRDSLHHTFAWSSSPKNLIGRNAGSALGRIGNRSGRGDQIFAAAVLL